MWVIVKNLERFLEPVSFYIEILKNPQAGLDWHGEVEEENSHQPIVLILPGFHSALNFSWWLDVKLNFTSLSHIYMLFS